MNINDPTKLPEDPTETSELDELYQQAQHGDYQALLDFQDEMNNSGLPASAFPEDHDSLLVRLCPGIPRPNQFKSDVVKDLEDWRETPGLLFLQAVRAIRVDTPDPVRAAYILALCISEPESMVKMFGPAGSELTYDLGVVVDDHKASFELPFD